MIFPHCYYCFFLLLIFFETALFFAGFAPSNREVSSLNWSEGQMSAYKVTRGAHYDANAITIAVPEHY